MSKFTEALEAIIDGKVDIEELLQKVEDETVQILWKGRLIEFKTISPSSWYKTLSENHLKRVLEFEKFFFYSSVYTTHYKQFLSKARGSRAND